MQALFRAKMIQMQRKNWHNKFIKTREFKEGDSTLLCDSKSKYLKWKFMIRRLGTYVVEKFYNNGSIKIKTIDEEYIPLLVNYFWLEVYKKPSLKDEFKEIVRRHDLNVIESIKALNLSRS